MKYPGFVGATYQSQSVNFAAERCVNFYPELIESGPQPRYVLYPTPGLILFKNTTQANVRGGIEINGRTFWAAAGKLYELASDATLTDRGNIANATTQVSFAASNLELVFCSNGTAYSYNLGTNTLAAIAALSSISVVEFSDGYFIALQEGTNKFFLSAPNDATTWDPLDVIQPSIFSGNMLSIRVSHRELFTLGPRSSGIYYDAGSEQVFEPRPEVLDQGAGAAHSVVRFDNSLAWLGANEEGQAMVWRLDGYTPKRISTHAIEHALQGYATISDCIGYSFQFKGHTFLHLYFPTANAAWRYDAATNLWHEALYWTGSAYVAHHSRCHVFAFGKHLVGDWNSGKIYQMSDSYHDDAGDEIRRLRQAPHLNSELNRIFYPEFRLDLETGVGLVSGQGTNPTVNLSWSNDGGHTWTDERSTSAGLVGQYGARCRWLLCGQGRNRVYRVVMSDPVPWRIQDAYLPGATVAEH